MLVAERKRRAAGLWTQTQTQAQTQIPVPHREGTEGERLEWFIIIIIIIIIYTSYTYTSTSTQNSMPLCGCVGVCVYNPAARPQSCSASFPFSYEHPFLGGSILTVLRLIRGY